MAGTRNASRQGPRGSKLREEQDKQLEQTGGADVIDEATGSVTRVTAPTGDDIVTSDGTGSATPPAKR